MISQCCEQGKFKVTWHKN